MRTPTFEQVQKAESFLADKSATPKQKAIAREILHRNEVAAIEAGQADIDYLDDGIPEDDY